MGRSRLQVRNGGLTMGAQQVVARITHSGQLVEPNVRRPVRLTPTGFAGGVYGGAVYPLHDGNVVDIAESSWEIADCHRFLFPGNAIPYSADSVAPVREPDLSGVQWWLETTDFGHYLQFNSSESEAGKLVFRLEAHAIAVQRWDVSHRPSSDGKFYDWFARLSFIGPHHEVLQLVERVLASDSGATAPTAEPNQTTSPSVHAKSLDARVEDLVDANAAMSQRLETSVREIQDLHHRLTSTERRESSLLAALDRVREHQKSIQDEVAELSRSSSLGAEARELLANQSDAEELLQVALAENADLHREVTSLRAELAAALEQARVQTDAASELQQRLAEVASIERERRRVSAARAVHRRGIEGFVAASFARIDFVLDGQEVLAGLDSPMAVMRCLHRVDAGENIGKGLAGLSGWREVSKLATGRTGSEDMGRVYYKPHGGRVLVSVHVKQDEKEQRRHIELLRGLD